MFAMHGNSKRLPLCSWPVHLAWREREREREREATKFLVFWLQFAVACHGNSVPPSSEVSLRFGKAPSAEGSGGFSPFALIELQMLFALCCLQDHLMRLVGSLQSYKMEPLIVFSFSRRECEAYSLACANPDMGNLCFADADEAAAIEEVSTM
jgi:hypothetical protein